MEIMAEPTILETNASGELQIPAGALGAGPHARFRLEHEGDALRLIPEAPHALWDTLPPRERARTFRDWSPNCRSVEALPFRLKRCAGKLPTL
jgi:hypothetical protein